MTDDARGVPKSYYDNLGSSLMTLRRLCGRGGILIATEKVILRLATVFERAKGARKFYSLLLSLHRTNGPLGALLDEMR